MLTPAQAGNAAAQLLTAISLALPPESSMTARRAFYLCQQAWLIWGIWWLLMAFFSKGTKRRETVGQRLEHLVPTALGFLLVFEQLRLPRLAQPLFPDVPALALLALAVTFSGLVFSAWARLALGANWSGSITIKKGHQLIRGGPYRFIRHPIYTGMLAALLATAVTGRLTGGLVGFAVVLLALYRKARREESFLSQEFGDAFVEHLKHTGMFLPRFS